MTAEERVCEQIRMMFGDMDERLEQAVRAYGKHLLEEGFNKGRKYQRNADVRLLTEKADMLAKLPLVTQPKELNKIMYDNMDELLITEQEDE